MILLSIRLITLTAKRRKIFDDLCKEEVADDDDRDADWVHPPGDEGQY